MALPLTHSAIAAATTVPRRSRHYFRHFIEMAFCVLLIALVVFGVIRLRSNGSDGQHMTPALTCIHPTYDFGFVAAGAAADLKHDFLVTNATAQTVKILRQATSCGCTTAALSKSVFGPGESISVPVTLKWNDRSGRQTAYVWLTTGEPGNPVAMLTCTAKIVNPVLVTPSEIEFSEINPGPADEQIFEVFPADAILPFRITDLQVIGDPVRIKRISEAGNADPALLGGPGRFAVSVIGSRTRGAAASTILLSTSVGTKHLIAVRAVSRGVLSAMPQSLFFDTTQGSPAVAEVRVRSIERHPAARLSARMLVGSDSGIIIEAVATDPPEIGVGGSVKVRCAALPRMVESATLRISFGDDWLDIPIAAIVKPAKR